MRLRPILAVAANGEIVDAHGLHPTFGQILRGLVRNIDKILDKGIALPAALRIDCLEQHALTWPDIVWLQLVYLNRLGIGDLQDASKPDGGLQRHSINGLTVTNKVDRRIHMRPGMRAHREPGDVANGTCVHAHSTLYLHRRIVRPMHHPTVERHGDIDPRAWLYVIFHLFKSFQNTRTHYTYVYCTHSLLYEIHSILLVVSLFLMPSGPLLFCLPYHLC